MISQYSFKSTCKSSNPFDKRAVFWCSGKFPVARWGKRRFISPDCFRNSLLDTKRKHLQSNRSFNSMKMTKRQLWLAFETIMAVYLVLSCCISHTDLPGNNFDNKNKADSRKKLLGSYTLEQSLESDGSSFNFSNIDFFFYANSNNIRIQHYFFCRNYLYWF